MRSIMGAAVLALCATNGAPSVAQAKQKFIEIKIAGATNVSARDINDNGDVTGSFTDSSGASHGFLRAVDGTITTFDVPGASSTFPVSINNAGQIAGNSSLDKGFLREPDGTITSFAVKRAAETYVSAINKKGVVAGTYAIEHEGFGFVRTQNGKMQTFNVPNSYSTNTSDINSSGTTAGYYYDSRNNQIGFSRAKDGTVEEFSITEDAPFTKPAAINSVGWIAGNTEAIQGFLQGFLRDPEGNCVTFDPFSDLNIYVTGLNDKNWVVGFANNGDQSQGFVRFPDGTITAVNDPNASYTYPRAINKAGTVTGDYQDSNYVDHGFIVRIRP